MGQEDSTQGSHMSVVPPSFGSLRFSCPHCGAFAHQHWRSTYAVGLKKDRTPLRFDSGDLDDLEKKQNLLPPEQRFSDFHLFGEYRIQATGKIFQSEFRTDTYSYQIYNLDLSACDSCGEASVWLKDKLVHPSTGPVGAPSKDMPPTVRELYEEAGAVFQTSPKSSAALLRLALQHLLPEVGGKGKNINDDINDLIENGLEDEMAKTMHALRIVGNEAVHPGEISVDDEPYIAEALFDLLNQIVDQMITRPKRKQALWERLPENKRADVERRLEKRKNVKH